MAPFDKPRRTTRGRSFDAVLSFPMTVTHDGMRYKVPAEKALLLDLRHKSRNGDTSAGELLAEYTDVVTQHLEADEVRRRPMTIRRTLVRPGSVSLELEALRMMKKFDRYSSRSYRRLEPWLVQAALDRLGERRLSRQEQRIVYSVTRTPSKVQWPDWWEVQE